MSLPHTCGGQSYVRVQTKMIAVCILQKLRGGKTTSMTSVGMRSSQATAASCTASMTPHGDAHFVFHIPLLMNGDVVCLGECQDIRIEILSTPMDFLLLNSNIAFFTSSSENDTILKVERTLLHVFNLSFIQRGIFSARSEPTVAKKSLNWLAQI